MILSWFDSKKRFFFLL